VGLLDHDVTIGPVIKVEFAQRLHGNSAEHLVNVHLQCLVGLVGLVPKATTLV